MGLGRLIQLMTGEGAEHENTTTEGSIFRKTFAANELMPGKVYHLHCGINVNDENSTDTALVGVRFGTTSATPASNTSCGASAAIDTADNDKAVVHAILEIQSATRAVIYGTISAPDAANVEKVCSFGPVVHTLDTAVPNYWDVTIDFSVAHADNEVAAFGGHVIEFG